MDQKASLKADSRRASKEYSSGETGLVMIFLCFVTY